MTEGNIQTKGLVFSYPDARRPWYHPKDEKEMKAMHDRMCECNKINDTNGVFTCAMQLLPSVAVRKEDIVRDEIQNFINYLTSDDEERKKMKEALGDFINEVFED